MRRAVTLAVCFFATAACRGGAAQEASPVAKVPAAIQAPAAEPTMAGEIHVPWSIALLSDEPRPATKRSRAAAAADAAPAMPQRAAREAAADVQVVVDLEHADATPAAGDSAQPARTCSGVVNRRS